MPCLQTHTPEDMEQLLVISVPTGLQPQAATISAKDHYLNVKTHSRPVQKIRLRV